MNKGKLILFLMTSIFLSGCVKEIDTTSIPSDVGQKKETKIVNTKEIPIPHLRETKYIKILILPFENSENDVDYGGYIETKLESSKFIFDENLKNKLIEEDLIGGI